MEEFFQMGGYARFIWPAYIVVALVLIGLWFSSQRFQRTSEDKLLALNSKVKSHARTAPHEA